MRRRATPRHSRTRRKPQERDQPTHTVQKNQRGPAHVDTGSSRTPPHQAQEDTRCTADRAGNPAGRRQCRVHPSENRHKNTAQQPHEAPDETHHDGDANCESVDQRRDAQAERTPAQEEEEAPQPAQQA